MVFDVSVALTWILYLALFPMAFFWFRRAWRIVVKRDFSEVAIKRGESPPDPEKYAPYAMIINLIAGVVASVVIVSVDSEYGRQLRQPDEIGGASTQGIYVIVNSADALYAQAKAAGAQIVVELKDEDYGGRGFTCRDIEGHLWSFGTYDPWADEAAGTVAQA